MSFKTEGAFSFTVTSVASKTLPALCPPAAVARPDARGGHGHEGVAPLVLGEQRALELQLLGEVQEPVVLVRDVLQERRVLLLDRELGGLEDHARQIARVAETLHLP